MAGGGNLARALKTLAVCGVLMLGFASARAPAADASAVARAPLLRARLNSDIVSTNPGTRRDENTDGVLLHIVDLAPFDDVVDPVAEARAIVNELRKYDETLFEKPRWLVLNKLDMVPEEEREARVADFLKRYEWDGPVFEISALTGQGCENLCYAIYDYIAAHSDAQRAAEAEDLAADVRFREKQEGEAGGETAQ